MRIAVRHRFGRFLGRGIEGHLGVGLVRLAIGHFGIGTIGRAGRGQQHVPRRMRAGGLKQLERADQVRFQIGAGVLDRVAHARLRGQMHDDIGLVGREKTGQHARFLDPRAHGGKAGMGAQAGLARLFQGGVVIGVMGVQPDDLGALGQQQRAQVIADEAGRAGDKDAHQSTPNRSRVKILSATSSSSGVWRLVMIRSACRLKS